MAASHPEPEFFDQLRNDWKRQTNTPAVDLSALRASAEQELQQQQRRHLRSTIFASISFLAAIIVTSSIFLRYNDHGPLFYGAIIAVNLLMIFMGTMLWLGVQNERTRSDLSNLDYMNAGLRRLKIRRFTIRYAMPVYMVLLFAALSCYYADLFAKASLLMNLAVYGGTLAYVLTVYLLTRRKNRRKLDEIERLIRGLEQLRDGLQTGNQ